jgi:hypothetical protein
LFGKKYNESTGAISGEPVTTTTAVVATAPWWGAMLGSIITTLGLAYITGSASPAPGETIPATDTTPTTPTTGSKIVPLLLLGGAGIAAYYYLTKKK